MALPPRPDFDRAFRKVVEVYNGNASQERANVIRQTLQEAQTFIDAAIAQKERDVNPWMIRDCVAIARALEESGIEGVVRLRVAPSGKDLPGEYTVDTAYGKFIGEGAQLVNTIKLVGIGVRLATPPSGADDVDDSQLDEFAAEHGE
jgi:hypothetical protein